MRLATVIGTRPQFVKAYPLSRKIRETGHFDEIVIHTGQHFDPEMSDVFFAELGMRPPLHSLNIHGGNHGDMTGRMLAAIERVLLRESPGAILVYGDTNSTLAGALAAAKLKIPVVHIEAGLRSFNRAMPEEINRVVVDHLSSILFCPTARAVDNLQREGMTTGVHQVGDLTFDATVLAAPLAAQAPSVLEKLRLEPNGYGIVTIHRAENLQSPARLSDIASFLSTEARERPLILPLHPRTRATLRSAGIILDSDRLRTINPLGYLDMYQLLHAAAIVITDSGGLQREAYFHRVPCITLRDETEWVETIEHGWNRLWTDSGYRSRSEIPDFGSGPTAGRIIELLHTALIQSEISQTDSASFRRGTDS